MGLSYQDLVERVDDEKVNTRALGGGWIEQRAETYRCRLRSDRWIGDDRASRGRLNEVIERDLTSRWS